jgi:MoaA/NifB/PqqE/SkfB family radical SAM enzyme
MIFNSEQKINPQFIETSEENLSIEVTTECNGLCGHCFVRANVKEPKSLSLETAGNIITEGYDLGYRHLHITGGEPLLWKPLSNLLDMAFERGFQSVFCNTNGTMLTEEKCKILTSYGNKLIISVSLHGDERVHDCMCGSGSYGRTTRGLRNAIEGGIKTVVFSTIGKSLLGELPGFVNRIFGEYSIELLTLIQMIRVKDDIFDLSSELLSPRDFIRLVNTVSLLNLHGLSVEILENPLANVVADISATNWLPKARFLHRKGRIVVLANGRIVPSHSSSDLLGIYRPGIMGEILVSERYRDAVSSNNTICTRCEHHTMCTSHDMNRPSEWFRDMHAEVPYCKRVLECLKASEFGDRCHS